MMTIDRTMLASTLLVIGLTGTGSRAPSERASADEPTKEQRIAGVPLAGTVVDPAGKPLADAEVWLTTLALDGKPATLGKTKTDASGRFRLAVPDWWFQIPHSSRQELGLIAAKEGYRLGAICYSNSSIPAAVRAPVASRHARLVRDHGVRKPDKTPLFQGEDPPRKLVGRLHRKSGMILEEHARTLAGDQEATSSRRLRTAMSWEKAASFCPRN